MGNMGRDIDMHTKTVFIPTITLTRLLQFLPGQTLENIEERLGAKCTYERNHPNPNGGDVGLQVIVVDSPHAQVHDLCNTFASNGPGWWLE